MALASSVWLMVMLFPNRRHQAGRWHESPRAVSLTAGNRGVNHGNRHKCLMLAHGGTPAISHIMSEDRLILAIGRLERALARVENAAQKSAVSAPPVDHEAQAAWNALSTKHERLKQQVEGAIVALDGIIAKG